MFYVVQGIFFGIPIAALLFFLISLYRFCNARKKNVSKEEMKSRKMWLIVSSVILGVLAGVLLTLAILLYMAIAYM